RLKHLIQVRHATCTSPVCRRPAAQADFEHNTPYEAGGRTCLCNTGPKCRHDHRLKQHPRWTVDQLPDGTFRWTTPVGRTYTTEPTRYPIYLPPAPSDRRQQPRYPMLVSGTDSIRNMDVVDDPDRYRPYLWKMWSWPVTSTSAT